METQVINFKVPKEIHRKLRSVAISKGTTITALLNDFIKEKIDALDREALVEQLRGIPSEERLGLIRQLDKEEKEMKKKSRE